MPNRPVSIYKFWQELKRRRVIRVLAMYAATAFIILEVVDIVSPALLLPSWTISLVVVLLAIGFPVVAILSWIFDLTPDGFMKTDPLEKEPEREDALPIRKRKVKLNNIAIVLLLAVVGILVYPKVFKSDKFEDIREEDGRISIAVMPFQNLTNDTLWNVWQVGIQNELITNLSNSPQLSVRQYQTMQEILQNSDQYNQASFTFSKASEITRRLNANTFIQGTIKTAGDKIRLNAHLIDANSEEIFKTFQIEGHSEKDVFLITDSLSNLVKNHLEIRLIERNVGADLLSRNATNSAEAYRYYIEGLNAYYAANTKTALEMLNRSIRLDPDFFAPYPWLLYAYNRWGFLRQDYSQIELAKHLRDKLLDWDVNRLSPRDQLTLKMIIARYVDKNPQEFIAYSREMLKLDPQQRIIWFELGNAYSSIQKYQEAIEAYEMAVEISRKWGLEGKWLDPYAELGQAYHHMGDHQMEREIFKRGLSFFPDANGLYQRSAVCALIRGDTIQAREDIANYRDLSRSQLFWTDTEVDHRVAHMYANAGLLKESEKIWRRTIASEPSSDYHKRCFAEFLILKEVDVEEGLSMVDEILRDNPDYYDILFFKGVGLYKLGHTEQALQILKEAWEKRFTYRHDHYLATQEVEQALKNQ
ncbi:MAG: FlgO family outer membrane protein [Bacteroidales bacterium]